MSDYLGNIISEDREGLVVYKTSKVYEDTQYDLIIPPDLISPNSTNNLEIPEYLGEEGMEIFNVDTKLENIKIIRTGRDSYISLKTTDKKRPSNIKLILSFAAPTTAITLSKLNVISAKRTL